jgi:hypothetical protein
VDQCVRGFCLHEDRDVIVALPMSRSPRSAPQAVDAVFLQFTIAGTIRSGGQSVMLLFAFEYVILVREGGQGRAGGGCRGGGSGQEGQGRRGRAGAP